MSRWAHSHFPTADQGLTTTPTLAAGSTIAMHCDEGPILAICSLYAVPPAAGVPSFAGQLKLDGVTDNSTEGWTIFSTANEPRTILIVKPYVVTPGPHTWTVFVSVSASSSANALKQNRSHLTLIQLPVWANPQLIFP